MARFKGSTNPTPQPGPPLANQPAPAPLRRLLPRPEATRAGLILPALAILLLTVAAYLPAIRGDYIWDDDSYLTENRTITEPGGLRAIWLEREASPQYYPLVFSSFWLEHRLWGLNPMGYHLVNVLLHALSALLLWRLLWRLGVPGAWLAAAVFALHPVHVESVAWITERKNVLSGFFYLLATTTFWRFAEWSGPEEATREGHSKAWLWAGLTLICFGASLLSKTVTSTLPAALLLLLWWQRGRWARRELLLLLPMLLIGAAMGLSTAWLETHHVGASGGEWDFSTLDRCLIAGRALWFYASKIVWPWPLVFFYPLWTIDSTSWWQHLFPLSALALVFLFWRLRRRWGRGPLVALLFFGGTLFPALGFINVYPMRFSFVADHFQYLASIGIIVLLSATASRLVSKPVQRRVGGGGLLALLGILSWHQAHSYANAETLWRETLRRNPGAFAAHNMLGLLLYHQGRISAAIPHFERAIELKPDSYEAYNNLGLMESLQGDVEEAVPHLLRSIEIQPDYVPAWVNLGIAEHRRGNGEEAVAAMRTALEIVPDATQTLVNLGSMLALRGDVEGAAEVLDKAEALGFVSAESQRRLAGELLELGQLKAAYERFELALSADPRDARSYNGKGVILARVGRLDEAIAAFELALRFKPGELEYAKNLGRARRGQARRREELEGGAERRQDAGENGR